MTVSKFPPNTVPDPQAGQDQRAVLVVVERLWRQTEKVTFELLGDARKLGPSIKARVELALLCSPADTLTALRDLQPYVREPIHLFEDPLLEDYTTSVWLQCLQELFVKLRPSVLMLAATAHGRDLGPRLAARLGVGYLPHCLTLRGGAGGRLEITRVTHGGRVHTQTAWPTESPVIITMKPGVADAPARLSSPQEPLIVRHRIELQPGLARVRRRIPADPQTQDIREAEKIIAGGRGVGGSEGFKAIRELADALNAAVAASRVAVDLGWIEYSRQVGQTGKTVAPKLYLAAGISGASHHLMGMRGSEKIVAVNSDKQAPIFSASHFGVVGDLHQILPRLAERVRNQRAQKAEEAEQVKA